MSSEVVRNIHFCSGSDIAVNHAFYVVNINHLGTKYNWHGFM